MNYNTHSKSLMSTSSITTTTTIAATSTRTAAVAVASSTTATVASLDRGTTIILIDSINNNSNKNNNNVNTNLNGRPTSALVTSSMGMTAATCITTPILTPFVEIPENVSDATTPNGNSSNATGNVANASKIINHNLDEIIEIEKATTESAPTMEQPRTQKRRSLLNFKSLDFHIKSFYTGLRSKHVQSQSSSLGGANTGSNANVSGSISIETPTSTTTNGNGCRRAATIQNRMPPYLKIEDVDTEESENLLLDYPQSPYSSRRNSSPHDNNRSSSQLLHIDRYGATRSQAASPSRYFLSPYVTESGNIRRSSTSDITSCKPSGSTSASDSRRPSTSDLLRRARERRGSEARMGRSVSHSGLPRGGRGGPGGGGGGGRRTSIAF